MRASEFIVEQEYWMRMDPPEVAKWRDQLRVQDITSGPESTFSLLAPPNKQSKVVPIMPPKPPEDKQSYKDAPRDEYWASAPSTKGGKVSGPDQTKLDKQKSRRDVEVDPDYFKNKSVVDPDAIKKQRLVPPNISGGTKERYRT